MDKKVIEELQDHADAVIREISLATNYVDPAFYLVQVDARVLSELCKLAQKSE